MREGLDQIIREVTEASTGIALTRGDAEPGENICTVHIGFRRGFHSSLSLRADSALFARLAQSMLSVEQTTAQDLEDVAKEYFNVLCGRIAGAMFQATQVPAHFNPPAFYRGRFEPEGREVQFVLTYSNEYNEGAQLIHHVPCAQQDEDAGDIS